MLRSDAIKLYFSLRTIKSVEEEAQEEVVAQHQSINKTCRAVPPSSQGGPAGVGALGLTAQIYLW